MAEAGLLRGLIIGVAALVVSVMIAFVVVSNVATVDDDIQSYVSYSVTNETGAYVNETGYTLAKADYDGFKTPVITSIINVSDGLNILTGNASVSATGVVTNATSQTWGNVLISYNFYYTPTSMAADSMISNFTSGVDNVSSKIPTVLLIAAVVLILGILGLLWQQYQKMDMDGGGAI